jgi:energy-coupling factor transporter ATP-binding protein EcfA2
VTRCDLVLRDLGLSLPNGREIVYVDRVTIAAGTTHLVSGPSGSGKSTLFLKRAPALVKSSTGCGTALLSVISKMSVSRCCQDNRWLENETTGRLARWLKSRIAAIAFRR